MAGKRVAVIGTGASGIQVIQALGPQVRHVQDRTDRKRTERTEQVSHLTVFQRTPNIALPMRQYKVSKEVQDHFKPVYDELYKKLSTSFIGGLGNSIPRSMMSDSEEEREANFEKLWDLGGFYFLGTSWYSLLAFLTRSRSGKLPGRPERWG